MHKLRNDHTAWHDALTRRLSEKRADDRDSELLAQKAVRNHLVVRVRWLLLCFVGMYLVSAGSVFIFSRYGLTLSPEQKLILLTVIVAVAAYNIAYQFFYRVIRRFRFADFLQVVLDVVCVTALVHISGGAVSWFWAVYLVITIEAAFLLDRRAAVWYIGAIGGGLYGALLLAEYFEVIHTVTMPFVSESLHHDAHYLLLQWLWVVILNTVTAIITTFLMGVIRSESRMLRESEERLLNFIDTANDLIFSVTPAGKFIYINKASEKTLGQTLEDLGSRSLPDIIHDVGQRSYAVAVAHALKYGRTEHFETQLTGNRGAPVPIEGGLTCSYRDEKPEAIWWICRDITDRKLAQQQLYQLAHFDSLTGLPNRVLFRDRLKQARAFANREGLSLSLLFLDLDRFKIINDTLGHPVGDKLLQSVAKRLSASIREIDTASRIGGDEFMIILVNLHGPADAEKVAVKILASLATPHMVDAHELFVTTSIGISMFPSDDEDLDNLIKKADIAMYAAKSAGSNTFRFYENSMDEHAHKRFVLENSMRKALEANEFVLHYQPKVDIVSGEITALEALLRWEHPALGLLSPAEFIPLAEETGMIIPLGEWVIRTACGHNAAWQIEGLKNLRVAVNLSGYQLQQNGFIETVSAILESTGLSSDCLEFEITETVIMQNPDFTINVLNGLRDMGIHISIDDFGTGYSSLSHLKRFSVNTLKIDKSFVSEVESNSTDAAIATAIIAMGNSLNLRVTAEGVETRGQFEFLREKLCDEIQGYYYSRPLPHDRIQEFMKDKIVRQPGLEPGSQG